MGLRCSLFGHSFGEAVTERDRETRGAEVVITVREVQTCRRCGAEQVIAENTEVRHLGTDERAHKPKPDEETSEPTPAEDSPAEEPAETPTETDDEPKDISKYVEAAEEPAAEPEDQPTIADASETDMPADEDVEFIDGSEEADEPEPASAAGASADASTSDAAEIDPDTEVDADPEPATTAEQADEDDQPEEDDAIIMDNVAGEEDRQSDIGRRELAGTGNMFDASPPEGGDGGSVTPPQSEPEPRYTEPEESSTEYSEHETEPDETPTDASAQQWPGEDPDPVHEESAFQFGPDMQATEDEDGATQKRPSGLTTEGPVNVSESGSDAPPRSVICPECGYETRAVGSSLRAGDICPECHGGYLADRH